MTSELLTVEVVADDTQPPLKEFNYNLIADPAARDWAESAAGFITFGLGQAVVKVLEAGNLLMEAKERLKPGEYLPWVEQACGLKPSHAAKLVKAAQWINVEHAPHVNTITDATTLFLLSADATPEDVREWALERCAAGDPPTRKEVQDRKRQAQGKQSRTLEQEALSVLRLSAEARGLAARAEHISTRQLMDALDVDELPKGKRHETIDAVYCRNGTGWWKLPLAPAVDVPVAAPRRIQTELLPDTPPQEAKSEPDNGELVAISVAAERLGKSAKTLSVALAHAKSGKRKTPKGNGWQAEHHPERGKCIVRRIA